MLIKRLTLDELRKRNLSNLLYIKKITQRRWRKHVYGGSLYGGFMDENSIQKGIEYAAYLRDIRLVIQEKTPLVS
jgi:hypothetical protein